MNNIVSFSPFHAVSEIEVPISPDPNKKEVYKQGSTKIGGQWVDLLALSNVGLSRLMNAAGIRETRSERTDDRSHPHICSWQFSAEWAQPDSTVLQYSADYDLDLRDYIRVGETSVKGARFEKAVQDERVNLIGQKYAKQVGDARGEARIQACDKVYAGLNEEQRREVDDLSEAKALRYIVQMRQFIVQRAQTGAMERVIRKMLGLKSTYTAEELKVPFRVKRSRWDWDRVDAALGQQEGRQLRELQAIQLLGIAPAQWQEFKKLSAPPAEEARIVSDMSEGEIVDGLAREEQAISDLNPVVDAAETDTQKLTTGQKQTEGKDPNELVGSALTKDPLKTWFATNIYKALGPGHYENHLNDHFGKKSVANLTWGQFRHLVDHVVDKIAYPPEYAGKPKPEKKPKKDEDKATVPENGLVGKLDKAGVLELVNAVLIEKKSTLNANESTLNDLLASVESGVLDPVKESEAIKDFLHHELR